MIINFFYYLMVTRGNSLYCNEIYTNFSGNSLVIRR